jgi:hypothetical protein
MAALFERTGMAVAACVVLLSAAGFAGFAAGFNARAGLGALGLGALGLGELGLGAEADFERVVEMSASDAVSLRFPSDWAEPPATAPMTLASFASADAGGTLLDPHSIYPAPVAAVEEPRPALQVASATPAIPGMSAKPAALAAAARPIHHSNSVLNESQIASIKRRLNLTPDQERYWPAVAAQLRKMEYKKDPKSPQGTRTAGIDMSKVDVQGLKSAGFPLVMSFNDDQRRELKSLAHLLGLEGVMSSF